jgi:solute:Na+ symporter, SSS family
MSPWIVLLVLGLYFASLVYISWYTGRNANSDAYFLGNKASPWYAVAFGMIGDSLSGVTFISVPGAVHDSHFSYLQVVLGYFFGYFIISQVLLPLYYKMNLTSIYSYLRVRFGQYAEITGSMFFLLSRILGAGGRLYLAASVIHLFVLKEMGVPFALSVAIILGLMLIYTIRGGIRTLVWTDVLQSFTLLLGVVLSIAAIASAMDVNFGEMVSNVYNDPKTETFFWDWKEKSFFPKQFFGGMLVAVAMTGLDQNMMQKNLSCRSLGDAQKNIRWFSFIVVIVTIFFLSLGVLLYQYAAMKGILLPMKGENVIGDKVFPTLALGYLGLAAGLVFILGLTAATFSSADSVLTTLTTSFYIDVLHVEEKNYSEERKTRIRKFIHIIFAIILLIVILLFDMMNNDAIINTILDIASYTYGPLLGLFAFGLFTKRKAYDKVVPYIAVAAPVICYLLSIYSEEYLFGYKFGQEKIGVNGLLVFAGLWVFSNKSAIEDKAAK